MRSISLFFLLSVSVQLSAGTSDFVFYMNTAGDVPAHCDNIFDSLNITINATSHSGSTVADIIDAVIDLCSGEGAGSPHQRKDSGRRNLHDSTALTASSSRELSCLEDDLCACQAIFACRIGGYCADSCGTICKCDRRRRLEDSGILGLQIAKAKAAKISIACTAAVTTLAAELESKDNYCLGMSDFLGFYVHVLE